MISIFPSFSFSASEKITSSKTAFIHISQNAFERNPYSLASKDITRQYPITSGGCPQGKGLKINKNNNTSVWYGPMITTSHYEMIRKKTNKIRRSE